MVYRIHEFCVFLPPYDSESNAWMIVTRSRNETTRECQTSSTSSPSPECADDPPPDEYSDLYLTSTLIEEVKADIPAVTGEWVTLGIPPLIAFGGLLHRETRYDATHGEWQVRVAPPMTCYLKVWVNQTFTPSGGGDPTVTEVINVWDPLSTGEPCVFDETKSVSDAANIISGPTNAVAVPESTGAVSLTLIRWSFVRGYEPDISDPDNPQPNGFPDPTWEPSAP